ncbi:Sugar transporter [Rhizoctonia solani]|uniref:Sugar transporter n=1 Tax=Rhizoctonia solani TaxID=456999 RepID=A0A8H7I9N4_9AGAM|nr:Sugar transporter [Rhizoctonia solani]
MANGKAIIFCFFVAFGGFLFGYDIGVISGCLIMPDFIERFGVQHPDGTWELDAHRQSIITSLLSAGTFVGAIGQAFSSDRFGRRWSIFIWCAIFTAGVPSKPGQRGALHRYPLGAMSAIVPLYNGETAPKKIRGALLVLYQLQIIAGIFLSYILDFATHKIPGSASWRIPVGLQLLWGLILCGGILFLPESPRYLLGQGREQEAREAISAVNGYAPNDPFVDDIVEELEIGIREENEGGKATWAECFSTRNKLWMRTGNGMMLQFIQQLNGQNFYYYYGDTFFKSAGTDLSPYIIQIILGGVSFVGTFPALYLIESWGRRRSLLLGAFLEGTCSLIAGLVGHFTLAPADTPIDKLTARNRAGGDVLIAFAVLHVFSFSIFWVQVFPWVYLGESFPLRVRSKAIALGSATNWIWNFLLSFFAPRIAKDIGPLILLIFFGMLTFGFVYVWFCIPETRGLSLEEVDEMYRTGVKPWHSADWKPHQKHLTHTSHPETGTPTEKPTITENERGEFNSISDIQGAVR